MTNEQINQYHDAKERYQKVTLLVLNREYADIFQSMRDDIKNLLNIIDNMEVQDIMA